MGFKPLPPKLCGLESYNADGTEKGVELMEACCEGMEMLDCDHLYRPSGMAWEDIAEFARDEQLWLRTYTQAWHMATENGQDLKYLDQIAGPASEELSDEESIECQDIDDNIICG